MTTSTPNPQALIQRAQLQTQANRYAFLRKAADARLITQIANK